MSKTLVVIREVTVEQRFEIEVNDTQAEDEVWIDAMVSAIDLDTERYLDNRTYSEEVNRAIPRYRIEG